MRIRKIIRNFKFNLIRLFRSKKKSHDIALGLSLGFFPCWFPTFGAGAVVSVAIAKLLKANVVAAVVAAGVGSVLWPVLFFLNYAIGNLFNFGGNKVPDVHDIAYRETIDQMNSTGVSVDFLTGAVVNSVVFGVISYFVAYIVFQKYRVRVLKRLRKR